MSDKACFPHILQCLMLSLCDQAVSCPADGGFAEGLGGQHKRQRLHVRPHALQQHSPALQGPLEIPDARL